jgi:hypothetical protein
VWDSGLGASSTSSDVIARPFTPRGRLLQRHFGELEQQLTVCADLAAPERRRRHSVRVGVPIGQLDRPAQRARQASPVPCRAELPDAEAQLVALHWIRSVGQLAIEIVCAPPSEAAKPHAAEHEAPRSSR